MLFQYSILRANSFWYYFFLLNCIWGIVVTHNIVNNPQFFGILFSDVCPYGELFISQQCCCLDVEARLESDMSTRSVEDLKTGVGKHRSQPLQPKLSRALRVGNRSCNSRGSCSATLDLACILLSSGLHHPLFLTTRIHIAGDFIRLCPRWLYCGMWFWVVHCLTWL